MTGGVPTIDLNADLGEGFPRDEALLDRVTSASVCCGAHAGGREESLRTLRLAAARGVILGAHPGYDDRPSFGRRELDLPAEEVEALVRRQVDWLSALADEVGVRLVHVKAHGALYNQCQRDAVVAVAVVAAVVGTGMALFGLPGGALEAEARGAGVPFVAEGFADRRYDGEGGLLPRSAPGAILVDPVEIASQALRLVDVGIRTICLHGDDPEAVTRADHLLLILAAEGITVGPYAGARPS